MVHKLTAIVVALLIEWVAGHRYGADMSACVSMKPGHGATRRQTRATPYIIQTNIPGYVPCAMVPRIGQAPNCGVMVRIRTRRGGLFKGFLLQARTRMPDGQIMNVGEFRYLNGQPVMPRAGPINAMRQPGQFGGAQPPVAMGQIGGNPNFRRPNLFGNQLGQTSNVIVQRLNCPRGFAVTHTENSPKNLVQLIWYPPVGYRRGVQFVATVVQDFNTYWMGHRSRTLKARPRLRMSGLVAQTARWFSGATRASSGVIVLIASLCSMIFYLL